MPEKSIDSSLSRNEFLKLGLGAIIGSKDVFAAKKKPSEELKEMGAQEALDYLTNVVEDINKFLENPNEPASLKKRVQSVFEKLKKGEIASKFTNQYYTRHGQNEPDKNAAFIFGYETEPEKNKIRPALSVSVPALRDYIKEVGDNHDLKPEDINFGIAANYAYFDIYSEVLSELPMEKRLKFTPEENAKLDAEAWAKLVVEIIRPRLHLQPNHKLPPDLKDVSDDFRLANNDPASKEWLNRFIKKYKQLEKKDKKHKIRL